MPLAQPQSKGASVHDPGAINYTSSSFGAISFTGIGNPATSAKGIDGGTIGMQISSPNGSFTTYPETGGMRTVSDAVFVGGAPPTAVGRSRGPLQPVDPVDDIGSLKLRLLANGGDAEAVKLCDEVFDEGITIGMLQRRLTRDQCERLNLRDGKQFQMFLEKVGVTGGTKNHCRLCSRNNAAVYNRHRDALRHLLKDHFGLWFKCTYW